MSSEKTIKQIRKFLLDQREKMIQLTKELCAIATENPPGNNFELFVDFLRGTVEAMGLSTQKIRVPEEYQRRFTPPETWGYPRFNLVARWDNQLPNTLHFNSHFDVVPATEDWETNPFKPMRKGGKLYGRGTCDMKGSLAASLFAVKALSACGIDPGWNIELSFTADEEIGGECGLGYLVRNELIRPDAAVICEGGSDDTIAYGHRGVLWADVRVEGVAGHGSNPKGGINAFEKGIRLADQILALKNHFSQRKSAYITYQPEFRCPSLMLGGESGGGQKVNIIPDRFHFTLDRRLIPEEDVTAVIQEIREVLDAAAKEDKELKAELDVRLAFNAGITDPKAEICCIAKKAVGDCLGKNAKLRLFGAFTDLHFLTQQGNCPTIGYGVEGEGIHGSRECIEIRSLVETALVYAEIMASESGARNSN